MDDGVGRIAGRALLMMPMRCLVAHLAVVCILAGPSLLHAQEASLASSSQSDPCRGFTDAANTCPSAPQVQVADVTFSGSLELPKSEQGLIAASIKERSYGSSVDWTVDNALEIAREGWQDRGYFRV